MPGMSQQEPIGSPLYSLLRSTNHRRRKFKRGEIKEENQPR
jgi:hypothetical protein